MKEATATPENITIPDELRDIGERLRTQNNRSTSDPMFCLQILVVETGLDPQYSDNRCWWNAEMCEVVYDNDPREDPDYQEWGKWEESGYRTRWETVKVFFTEEGCNQHMRLNGHNVKRMAHNGEVRTYVEHYGRCPEMMAIREWLMSLTARKDESS